MQAMLLDAPGRPLRPAVTRPPDPGHRVPHLAFQPDRLSDIPILPISEVETAYYLRLRVFDKPGVLAGITRILADLGISIDAMVQKEPREGEGEADIIMLTHVTVEKNVDAAISKLEASPVVASERSTPEPPSASRSSAPPSSAPSATTIAVRAPARAEATA